MYLEIWQIIVLVLTFGFCAIYNRKQGVRAGIQTTLIALHYEKIIEVRADGSIAKYSGAPETPK